MKTRKRILVIQTAIAASVAVSGVLYALADRYLIEHVEIANVSAAVAQASSETVATQADSTTTTDAATATTSAAASAAATAAVTATSESATAATATTSTTAAVFADDWNYQSAAYSVSIREVTTGSGTDTVTYFVADVVLTDATQLSSAFAKDSFGTNIIEYTSQIAANNDAVFAINGDYYGFRSDGIVIRNGVIYRDDGARIGLAFYRDGTLQIYDETQTTAQELLDAGVWNTLSFGPALLQNSVIADNLTNVEIDTNFGNHSIQGENPRTGIGIIAPNHFVFVVVDGRSPGYSRGVTLTEFAQIFKDLGCTDAYNIDGGGSSTMYFMGRVVNNPLGKNRERGTSDILYLGR